MKNTRKRWSLFVASMCCMLLTGSGTAFAITNSVSTTAAPLPTFQLSVTAVGGASGRSFTEFHPEGTVVTLAPAPAAGYVFESWSGACSGSAPSCTVTMVAAKSVTAYFSPRLTVQVSGSGAVTSSPTGIQCGSECSKVYPADSLVMLTATPAAGKTFNGWGGACAANGTTPVCALRMHETFDAIANFTSNVVGPYTLAVGVTGAGAVMSAPVGINCGSSCNVNFAAGTVATLSATPSTGYTFAGWSGACAGTGSCQVTMNANSNVSATFVATPLSTVYYFSDCQSGAAAGCVPGNNANAGTSPGAPKRDLSGIAIDALPAGTQLLFARGGVWTNFNIRLSNLNVTPTSPLVFDAYGAGSVPTLKTASGVALEFGELDNTSNDGGYTFHNLKLDGQGTAQWGLWLRDNLRNVTIENVEITGFAIAIHSQASPPYGITALVIRNSNISRNSDMGILGKFSDSVIEGNTFEGNNFSGSNYSHAMYLSGSSSGGRNNRIVNNRFINNSAANGVCAGGNMTFHGQMDGILIEGNTISQAASVGTCYGISVTPGYNTPEWFRNFVIRGNTLVNLGGCAICAGAAPGIVVENNMIVNTQGNSHRAIAIPSGVEPGSIISEGDDLDSGAIVRNNTIYFEQPHPNSVGVLSQGGSNLQIVSNLIYFGSGTGDAPACFSSSAPISAFAAWNNNLCYGVTPRGALWTPFHDTREGFVSATGFDTLSLSSDPQFASTPAIGNNWSAALRANSPAVNAGHPSLSAEKDIAGTTRNAQPDIGAYELP